MLGGRPGRPGQRVPGGAAAPPAAAAEGAAVPPRMGRQGVGHLGAGRHC